jgi:hypothetical protein
MICSRHVFFTNPYAFSPAVIFLRRYVFSLWRNAECRYFLSYYAFSPFSLKGQCHEIFYLRFFCINKHIPGLLVVF